MIKYFSHFKEPKTDLTWLESWVCMIEHRNGRTYERISLQTSLGHTHIWGLNLHLDSSESIVIFPGARTASLFWDIDGQLALLNQYKIYLVETNGLPNWSDGNSPDIHSTDYGHWAAEIIEQLALKETYVAGASFGGLICMKLALVRPDLIKSIFLLNPGCLQPFSLSFKNLYYNLLPVFCPTERNIRKFLDKAVFCKPTHQLPTESEQLLVDYEVFALKRYKDRTQKPYYMEKELAHVSSEIYLILGKQDLLFPYQRSVENAKKYIQNLKEIHVFEQVGHGIETYRPAIEYLANVIAQKTSNSIIQETRHE
jgi:pimeloyl-ACP methyl ester carboxylesterase